MVLESFVEPDGQAIHVIGRVSTIALLEEIEKIRNHRPEIEVEWLKIVVVKRLLKDFHSDINDWLTENKYKFTVWIAGVSEDGKRKKSVLLPLHAYGLGFIPGSKEELMFLLRWK